MSFRSFNEGTPMSAQPQTIAADDTGMFPSSFASFSPAQASLLCALAGMLLSTDDLTEGLRGALRVVCEEQGWPAGRFWTVDKRDGSVRELVSWQRGAGGQPVLPRGATAPRWLSKDPVWVGDLSAHELASLVRADAGVVPGTGALLPLRSRGEVVAIADFSAPDGAAPSAEVMLLLRSAAGYKGRYYRRGLLLEHLRDSERRAASTLELAAIGIAHVGESGRFI
jgi:hypothetical protein